MQRAKLGTYGNLHTVEVDGVVVGHDCGKVGWVGCGALVDELNESTEKCNVVLDIMGK